MKSLKKLWKKFKFPSRSQNIPPFLASESFFPPLPPPSEREKVVFGFGRRRRKERETVRWGFAGPDNINAACGWLCVERRRRKRRRRRRRRRRRDCYLTPSRWSCFFLLWVRRKRKILQTSLLRESSFANLGQDCRYPNQLQCSSFCAPPPPPPPPPQAISRTFLAKWAEEKEREGPLRCTGEKTHHSSSSSSSSSSPFPFSLANN